MHTPKISTAIQLWKQLQQQSGVELKLKGGAPGRDADLDMAVLSALKALKLRSPEPQSVEDFLKADARATDPTITVEILLVAILKSQRGFGDMMQEILDTLVMAEAKHAEQALNVEFKFDDVDLPIHMTLEEFRAIVQETRRILTNSGWQMPTKQQRWALWQAVTQDVSIDRNSIQQGFLPMHSLQHG